MGSVVNTNQEQAQGVGSSKQRGGPEHSQRNAPLPAPGFLQAPRESNNPSSPHSPSPNPNQASATSLTPAESQGGAEKDGKTPQGIATSATGASPPKTSKETLELVKGKINEKSDGAGQLNRLEKAFNQSLEGGVEE